MSVDVLDEGRLGEVVRAVAPKQGELVLVAAGQYSGAPGATRLTLVDLAGRERWDGFVKDGLIAALGKLLVSAGADAREGECDTMHATPWSVAWTDDKQRPWLLLDGQGVRLEVGFDVRVRWRLPIERARVARVEARLSADWTERTVALVFEDGEDIVIATERDDVPLVDPSYDGLNLMADAAWVRCLASALARALGVRLVADRALG